MPPYQADIFFGYYHKRKHNNLPDLYKSDRGATKTEVGQEKYSLIIIYHAEWEIPPSYRIVC